MKNILIIFILLQNICFAQNEGNIWYFGKRAGIDFNSGTPVGLTDSNMEAIEGCSSISDKNGNLLFYTNGINVWDRNHKIMPNGSGLAGHNSSTQSAIIVKKPGTLAIYYIFTVSNSLTYSEVNMNLQSGLGDITSNKNITLTSSICEKITAVKRYNGVDFWIITRIHNSNAFHSYLLNATGINTIPVISNAGINIPIDYDNIGLNKIGYLRASPNGKKIASANGYIDNLELLDFNDTTGVLTNLITFDDFAPIGKPGPYGVEFSPNSKVLYVSSNDVNNYNLFQYDLEAGSSTDIVNSRIQIASGTFFGAIQLAPDNRLYVAQLHPKKHLGIIQDPNTVGIGCSYDTAGFLLPGATYSYFGLPTFYSSITYPISIDYYNYCLGDSTFFKINTFLTIDSLKWTFGDTANTFGDTSSAISPIHIYSTIGTFTVHLTIYSEGRAHHATTNVTVPPPSSLYIGNDTTLCQDRILTLKPEAPKNSKYKWQDSITTTKYTIQEEGEYYLEIITPEGCYYNDTILVSIDECLENPILFKIPNVFSPNNDSYNDFFKIDGLETHTWNLSIYNRWGKLVFKALDYQNNWDGQKLSDGTYYYLLSNQTGNKITEYKGWVQILR